MELLGPSLQIALNCLGSGWHVFPCWPRTKKPMTAHGWHDASSDEAQVRAWWTKWPDANVAIACKPSHLAVLDCDHGLKNEQGFRDWRERSGLPVTYTVRTGRRDDYGVQMYFSDVIPDVGEWTLNGGSGQVKSLGGYVMAAGCVHPDSGETYEVLIHAPIAPTPDVVRALKKAEAPGAKGDGGPFTANRNIALTSIAGKLRNAGLSKDAIEVALLQVNADRCVPPMDEAEVKEIAKHAAEWSIPQIEPIVTLGTPKEPEPPKDWRTDFHSREEMENAPPAAFLIDDWLMLDAITALAAPVAQRKSLIALNVAHALCTKEPLFDHFAVVQQPTRVLYLCPEMGIRSFTERLRKIGLMPYVGNTLFCRTSSSGGELALDDMPPDALSGSVVIIDTAVRYLKGDENSSEHMREFAKSIFRLMRDGAVSVLLLHHSAKGTKDSGELTLENAMRGSGELGAFLSSCWATRLQDPSEPYQSASYVSNVKQRDFESKPFEVTSGPDCRLHIVADPETATVTLQTRSAFKSNKDGKDQARVALIKANAKLSNAKLAALLKEAGMPRSAEWIRQTKYELLGANGGMMP